MAYTVRFDTRIEWVISDEDAQKFIDCATPEMFIKTQEELLRPTQSLQDFVANGVIKRGEWSYETEDAVEDMGDWKGEKHDD